MVSFFQVSFHQRINRCHQNLFFSVFAKLACHDVAIPSEVESITVLSEDNESLQKFCKHLNNCMEEAGLAKKPIKQLCIMSRDDEFSLNPKALYIVVVRGDVGVIASNSTDGDYRIILHRILFYTGRVPVFVLNGPESATQKLEEIKQLPEMSLYLQRASCFSENPSGAQMGWLISALQSEMGRKQAPTASPVVASAQSEEESTAPFAATGVSNTSFVNRLPAHLSHALRNAPLLPPKLIKERDPSPPSDVQKQISDARAQIRGLQNLDGENREENTVRVVAAAAVSQGVLSQSVLSQAVLSLPPSGRDIEIALKGVISRGGKALPVAPLDHQSLRQQDLLSDVREVRSGKTYTEMLIARQSANSQSEGLVSSRSTNDESLGSLTNDETIRPAVAASAVSSSPRVNGGLQGGKGLGKVKSSSFADAWSRLEKLKMDHEQALRSERESLAIGKDAQDQDIVAKANSVSTKVDTERQEMIQKIKITEQLDGQNARLERLKHDAHLRAQSARSEEVRHAAAAQVQRNALMQQETAARAAAQVRYRELESQALNRGVQHLREQPASVGELEGEVVYRVPSLESGMVLDISQALGSKPQTSLSKIGSKVVAVVPVPAETSKLVHRTGKGASAPASDSLAGMDPSSTPAQIPSPDKFHIQDADANGAQGKHTDKTGDNDDAQHHLRQSALSDQETLPYETSPQDDSKAPVLVVKERTTMQRSRAPPAPAESPFRPEQALNGMSAPVTPIAPRVLIRVNRDSSTVKDAASVNGGGGSMPRVIGRRPSGVHQDIVSSPAGAMGPRVLSHRPSAASSADGTPVGTPRLRNSDDPQSRPVSQEVVQEELSDYQVPAVPCLSAQPKEDAECSDYPKATPVKIQDIAVADGVEEELSDYGVAVPLSSPGHGDICLLPASASPSPPRNHANRNSRNGRNSRSSYSSESGDCAQVGIGMMVVLHNGQLVVTGLDPSSAAAKSLVGIGDMICTIDGRHVEGMDDVSANALLLGVVHSAVILGVRHPHTGNQTSDVVIIRAPKSNAASRVASADGDMHSVASLQPRVHKTSSGKTSSGNASPPRATHSPPGLMWASLRAQVDMFAETQESETAGGLDGGIVGCLAHSPEPTWPGWATDAETSMHDSFRQHSSYAHTNGSEQQQLRHAPHSHLHSSNTGEMSGDTIRAAPADRVPAPVNIHVAAQPNAHGHMAHHPHLSHARQQQPTMQQSWVHAGAAHERYPGMPPAHAQHHAWQHPPPPLHHLQQQQHSHTSQQQQDPHISHQRPAHRMPPQQHLPTPDTTPNSTPQLTAQASPQQAQAYSMAAPGGYPPGGAGGQGEQYSAWLQHMEQSMVRGVGGGGVRGVQPHSHQHVPQQRGVGAQVAASSYTTPGSAQHVNTPMPQNATMMGSQHQPQQMAHSLHMGHEQQSHQAPPLAHTPHASSGSPPQTTNPSEGGGGGGEEGEDEEAEEGIYIVDDIPVTHSREEELPLQHTSHLLQPHQTSSQPQVSQAAAGISASTPVGSRLGAGGAPPFEAPPPGVSAPGASSVERGDFGFQVAQASGRKCEVGDDLDSMQVSDVAQEGVARFSGRVLKGDYVLSVNAVDLRGLPLGKVLEHLREAPAKSMFEFLDARQGVKSKVPLIREPRGREEMFLERLQRLRSAATDLRDLRYLSFLRNSSAHVSREELRPSFVVCGFPGVGKSTLINSLLAAMNACDYSVADSSTPTFSYTRYEQVLRGADNNPFIIADTSGLTGDEAVFASLRNILKGRQKNNTKMDNAWRSVKAQGDSKKRAHGLILVADVRQKMSRSIVDALNEMCADEHDLPVAIAWTHLRDIPVHDVMQRVRSMLTEFPRAVNFPALHYTKGQSGNTQVDYTLLDMLAHLRTQSLRYIKYSHHEAAFKS